MAFGVRQRGSTTVDAAVAATLELETYLRKPIATVPIAQVEHNAQDDDVIASVGRGRSDRGGAQDSMQKVLDRLEKIEEQLKTEHVALENKQNSRRVPRPRKRNNQKSMICWRCREEGHIARNCRSQRKDQGNEEPLEQ